MQTLLQNPPAEPQYSREFWGGGGSLDLCLEDRLFFLPKKNPKKSLIVGCLSVHRIHLLAWKSRPTFGTSIIGQERKGHTNLRKIPGISLGHPVGKTGVYWPVSPSCCLPLHLKTLHAQKKRISSRSCVMRARAIDYKK